MPPSSADSPSPARAPRAASPWAHVLRGESEAVPPAPSSPTLAAAAAAAVIRNLEAADRDREVAVASESCDGTNGNSKRTAWSLPSNGAIDVGPVMGAVSWPALGESAKASPKLAPPDSIKPASDGSSSSSLNPPPVRVNTSNPTPNSNRGKPNRRGGGSSNHGSHTNGGPVSPPPPASSEMPQQIVAEKLAGNGQELSPRDSHNSRNHSTNWDHGSGSRGGGFSPHSHGGSDHHRPFNRRGNGTSGSGPHNGGRRDSDRGGFANHSNDWNTPPPRHMAPPPPRLHHTRPQFIRAPPPPPPPGAAPFIGPPPPVRPFVGPPMGFPAEIPSPVFYVQAPPPFIAAPPVAHAMPPAIIFNHADSMRPAVLKQIEYYFSNDNLCKDVYLRSHMDEQGWVPVDLIADFNRVKSLTNNIPDSIKYILELVRTSEVVEVQDKKIRKRGDWMNWLLHSQTNQHCSTSSPHSPTMPNADNMMDRMQTMVLEDRASKYATGAKTVSEVGKLMSGNFVNRLHVGDSNEDRRA